MHITIDTREKWQRAKTLLEKQGVECHVEQLKHGDYILNNHIVFERKTLVDFVVSLKDGRLFRQTYNKLNHDKPYILILEGDKSSLKDSKMSREAIQGALVHLAVFMGIPVLRSQNYDETLKLMVLAGKQHEKYEAVNHKQVYLNQPKGRKASAKAKKQRILQSLPGIGKNRGVDLLNEFGSIKNILLATEDDLCNVNGIGRNTAIEIRKVLE